MFLILVYLFTVILCSAICSMVEAAILSIPMLRVRLLIEKKTRNAGELMYVKENIAATISTIVIINNSINIIGSIYIGNIVTKTYGDAWLGIASGLMTFMIIVFGEVIPKALGERFQITVSLFSAPFIRYILWAFSPIMWVARVLVKPCYNSNRHRVTEEEIKMMIRIGRDAGTVELDEEILINRVFHLNDLRAHHMMKPMKDVYTINGALTLEAAKEIIISSPYNRMVVYEGDISRVVGIVQHRVLLREIARGNTVSQVSEWMLPPIYVNHMMKADLLMEKFQSFHQHLFLVQDNFKQTIGLVTMEDVLEELFGEIYDEKDIRFRMMHKKQST